ncbi:MAG: TSUP family transporter [Myxococcota bacterium]
MPLPDALWFPAILFAASLAQGFFGFGFGIIAMSALGFGADIVSAAALVNASGLALTAWMVLDLRAHVLWRVYARIAPFLLVGVLCGVTALSRLDGSLMIRVLAVFVIGISLWNVASPHLRVPESRWLDGAVGLLGGLFGGAFNTGGPPIVVYVYGRAEPPDALKATIQVLFVSISLFRLPIAAAQGHLDAEVLGRVVVGVPAVALGAWLGLRLARRVEPQRFRRACWLGLTGLGVALLVVG